MTQQITHTSPKAPPSLRQETEQSARDLTQEAGGMFPPPPDISEIRHRLLKATSDVDNAKLREMGWISE